MEGFNAEQFSHFDPSAMVGFDAAQFEHFDPLAMEGFNAEQFTFFDPLAMEGFNAEQFSHFDTSAMVGFDATQVEHFDTEAVSGFGRGHMTGMDVDALVGFEFDHVVNLDDKAKEGFGDKVFDFENFDLDVRGELIGDEAQRMGGFGSFEDLLKQFGESGEGPTDEELKAMGWDSDFDPSNLDFGGDDINIGDIFGDAELAKALGAFGG